MNDLAILGPINVGARAFLLDRGVDLPGQQQTKTRTALEFFSKQASAAG